MPNCASQPSGAAPAQTSRQPTITVDGATHFIPHKEFVQRQQTSEHGSNPSSTPQSVSPGPGAGGGGLKAHLHHLLPRHAWFRVHLQIHQLASVPFVGGEFAIRWKFKHAHTPRGAKKGLLGIVKPKARVCSDQPGAGAGPGKKPKEDDTESHASSEVSPDSASSIGLASNDQTSMTMSVTSAPMELSARQDSSSGSTSSGPYSPTTTLVRTPSSQNIDPLTQSIYASSLSTSTATSRTTTSTSTVISTLSSKTDSNKSSASTRPPRPKSFLGNRCCQGSISPEFLAAPRGTTQFAPLKDHNAAWEHHLDIIVRLDVERDTHDLLQNEFKLVVMQRVAPEDENGVLHNSNPRFGALYLNLAEYAGVGAITRRYLLSESKTNATLKITLQLDHVGGERQWIAPPLPKGEILNGVAGLLDSDVYRTKPNMSLYGPYNDQEELEMDLRGVVHGIGEKGPGLSNSWLWELEEGLGQGAGDDGESINIYADADAASSDNASQQHDGADAGIGPGVIPFDVEKLPVVYGPKAAQTLIDALFNPVIVNERRRESPFTVFVKPEPRAMKPRLSAGTEGGDAPGDDVERTKNANSLGAGGTALTSGSVTSLALAQQLGGQPKERTGFRIHIRRDSNHSQMSQLSAGSQRRMLAVQQHRDQEVVSVYSVGSGNGSVSEDNQSQKQGAGASSDGHGSHDGNGHGHGHGGGMKAWWRKVSGPAAPAHAPATTSVR